MIDARFQPMARDNRPPTPGGTYHRAPFKVRSDIAGADLEREMCAVDARDIVIEGGFERSQIRNDGWPRGGCAPSHPDIRIYMESKHGPLKYECAAFDHWEHNLRAIVLWMQRQRLAIEEWGIGLAGEAYRGFAALPAGDGRGEWRTIEDAMRFLCRTGEGSLLSTLPSDLQVVYRAAARKAHPDAGGSEDLMSRVNRAKEFIEKGGRA